MKGRQRLQHSLARLIPRRPERWRLPGLPVTRQTLFLLVAAVVVLGFVLGGGTMAIRFVRKSPPVALPTVTALLLTAPATIEVGEFLTVTVVASPPVSGTGVLLLAQGTDGVWVQSAPLVAGRAELVFQPSVTAVAGSVTLRAMAGAANSTTEVIIRPGPAVDPLLMLAGPRSILAGGQESSMIVTIPLDAYGNPVADDTQVSIRAQYPLPPRAPVRPVETIVQATGNLSGAVGSGTVRIVSVSGRESSMILTIPPAAHSSPAVDNTITTVRVQAPVTSSALVGPVDTVVRTTGNLLAAARIFSQNAAGALMTAAVTDAAHSPAQTLRVDPGQPITVSIRAEPMFAAADGQKLVKLETDRLTDAYGNMLLDGAVVYFLVEGSDGARRMLPAVTFEGSAATALQAPLAPSVQVVRALVAGVVSAPISVTFRAGAGVQPFIVAVSRQDDAFVMKAGPLVGELGQLVADDTPVQFEVTGPGSGKWTLVGRSTLGYATASIFAEELDPGEHTVVASVGGGSGLATFQAP